MQYYPFSVAVGASHHVLARGNFLRYYEALTGTANPTLEIKPMGSGGAGSSEFLLRPGQSIKLPVSAPGFMIENFDGIATITGRLLIGEGDFNDSQISGNVTIAGNVAVTEALATSANFASFVAGTVIAAIAGGANSTRKKMVFRADESNTAPIAIGSGALTMANAAVVLEPGESWEVEGTGAGLAWYGISSAASQNLTTMDIRI
jgi:hypothetical protein